MFKSYITKVVEICDNGDCIIEFPEEMMQELGWKEGDFLDFDVKDGQIFVRNLTLIKGGKDV